MPEKGDRIHPRAVVGTDNFYLILPQNFGSSLEAIFSRIQLVHSPNHRIKFVFSRDFRDIIERINHPGMSAP